jgi:hypothetical protein
MTKGSTVKRALCSTDVVPSYEPPRWSPIQFVLVSKRLIEQMDRLFNPHAGQERDRRSQIGSQKTGRDLFHVSEGLHGFPTAPMDCQVLGDNAHALQWATPRSRKAAAQRQGSGDGHSDIKAVCALKLVMIGPERVTLIFHPRAGGRVSGKRLWRINAMEAANVH